MKNIFLTGSTGFVGKNIALELLNAQYNLTIAVREHSNEMNDKLHQVLLKDLSQPDEWNFSLAGIDVVIHSAAKANSFRNHQHEDLSKFQKINTLGTIALAEKAASEGVKRFIFLSSIKVNGEYTTNRGPFTADCTPNPSDAYGLSKWEAEKALTEISAKTGMEIVIIRPVLVYGPGVKANFHNLMKLIHSGLPLPLGAINNKRSFVSIDNLVDFIRTCIDHPAAAGEIFLVSDGDDLSTTELLKDMAAAMGKTSRLISIPSNLIKMLAFIMGKSNVATRLFDSLEIDLSKNADLLGWHPKHPLKESINKTVLAFLNDR